MIDDSFSAYFKTMEPLSEDSPRYLVLICDEHGLLWASRQNYIPEHHEDSWLLHELTKSRYSYYYKQIPFPEKAAK